MFAVIGREDEDALEPFAKYEDRDVEDTGAEVAMARGVRQPAGTEDLKDENRGDGGGTCNQRNGRNWYSFQHVGDIRP